MIRIIHNCKTTLRAMNFKFRHFSRTQCFVFNFTTIKFNMSSTNFYYYYIIKTNLLNNIKLVFICT